MSTGRTSVSCKRALGCAALAALLVGALPARASAWGVEGHHIIAMIAEKHLTPAARQRVGLILKTQGVPGCKEVKPSAPARDKMVCSALWPDGARFATHRNTYNWHFVSLSLSEEEYDAAAHCEPGNQASKGKCGVAGLDRAIRILRGELKDANITRSQALIFVVHVVGDLHQPLHTVKEKLGGNLFNVFYFDVFTDMHNVWDTKIIDSQMRRAGMDESGYADALDAALVAEGLESFQAGGAVAWVEEAHAAAIADAYGRLPKKKTGTLKGVKYHKLAKLYFGHNVGVVERQLKRGGARLAKVLNDALG